MIMINLTFSINPLSMVLHRTKTKTYNLSVPSIPLINNEVIKEEKLVREFINNILKLRKISLKAELPRNFPHFFGYV